MTDSTEGIDVDPEFIEENRAIKLSKTNQKSGGPYTKVERAKRRKEVYRLHFETGYPASVIADIMKINRNTINDDLRLLYKEVADEAPEYFQYFYKQMARLESQRSRVLSYLAQADDLEYRLAIERLAAEIDFRMLNAATKIEFSSIAFWDKVQLTYNVVAKKKGLDYRITSLFELMKISTLARKDLDEMYYRIGRSYRKANQQGKISSR